ncbi:MAG: hypothetical protein HFI06_08875 [Eubacterium sp.]|jgi:hypothetical protein|nr:hypothetical protein [Eubacterium sp.]NBI87026.1 hypothetical protein [Lachnospiraceae bacterium]
MLTYQVYDAGINTGTSYLTKEVAYFLGGIYAADEKVISNGKTYWAAPVRYNPTFSAQSETAGHFDFVTAISARVKGYTVMKDNIKGTPLDSGKNRLPGFSTFFESTGLEDLLPEIPGLKNALFLSEPEVKKAFIIGVIDGRGTPDASVDKQVIRYLSLDCPNNDIGRFLSDVMADYGLDINYNTARDRLEGGNPRKPQLRIKNVEYYLENTGYISPAKLRKLADVYRAKYGRAIMIRDDAFLPGLKYIVWKDE